MNTYTFHNVSVSIKANSGKQAYTRLCNLLANEGKGNGAIDWQTRTFSVNDGEEIDTSEIFPDIH